MISNGANIEAMRRAIAAYKAGENGASERLWELLEGVITNAARTFANKDLTQALEPKELGQIHTSAAPGSLGHYRPAIDRPKYAELRTDIFLWLLEKFMKEPIPDNPYAEGRSLEPIQEPASTRWQIIPQDHPDTGFRKLIPNGRGMSEVGNHMRFNPLRLV